MRTVFECARIAAFALCVIALSSSAAAQNANTGFGTPAPVIRTDRDDDTDYGWIGLAGLLGVSRIIG